MLILTGCSITSTGNPAPSEKTESTPTSDNAGTPCSVEDSGSFGDVIPDREVTDDFGTYCKTKVSPQAASLKWDDKVVDIQSLEDNGFTIDQAKVAQRTAVTFALEKTFDDARLDNFSQSTEEWLEDNADALLKPEVYVSYAEEHPLLSDSGLIVTDYLPEPLNRDGYPRFTFTAVQVNKIYGFESEQGTKVIVVNLGGSSTYNVTNEQVVNLYLKHHTDMTESNLKKNHPEFFQEAPVGLIVQGDFTFSFRDDFTKIVGSNSDWHVNTQTGVQIIE